MGKDKVWTELSIKACTLYKIMMINGCQLWSSCQTYIDLPIVTNCTLQEINIDPGKSGLKDLFPLNMSYFQGLCSCTRGYMDILQLWPNLKHDGRWSQQRCPQNSIAVIGISWCGKATGKTGPSAGIMFHLLCTMVLNHVKPCST